MAVSQEFLARAARTTGFQIGPLEKVVRLGELAHDISRHPLLGDTLALKGGTAINLCFGEPKRMSVDLDYNYIGHLDRDGMLADRPKITQALIHLATRRGYKVQTSADEHAGHTLFLRYKSVEGSGDQIKVDANFMMRLSLDQPKKLQVWQPGDLDQPAIMVVGLMELLIGKMLAFLDRAAARDAWDLANLPGPMARVPMNEAFRPTFLALCGMLIHQPSVASEARIRKLVSDDVVQKQLLPMLVDPTGVTGTSLVDTAWPRVAPFVDLSEAEDGYYKALTAGELKTDLLFPSDPAEATRLASHPALLWRVANVREHLRKR
jgi:hypothetical protein